MQEGGERLKSNVVRAALTLLLVVMPLPLPFLNATRYELGCRKLLIDELWGIHHTTEDWEQVEKGSGMKSL